jgi:cardiolipin synthase A/B
LVALGLVVAQDQETLRIRSPIGADDPRFAAYIAALVGTDLTAGNRYEVLANGDRMFPSMLAAINAARERIKLETYIYKPGEVGKRFTEAFEAAARRGVRVIIVVDEVGSNSMAQDDVKRLTDAGCVVAKFNLPHWYSLENINYRTHRKILAIDGEVGFTGGAGIDDQWLGNAQDPRHWRDTMIRMQGPIVRLLEAAFYENYIEAGGVVSPAVERYPAPPADETGPSLLVRSTPTGGSNDLKRLYLLSIAAARRTLDVASPYFITDESSMWSLEDAVNRGVKIRILTEGTITDAMPVKYASRAAYEKLLGLGIEIYEYQPTMMHTKALVVDNVWSLFGSANFDNRSLELNDELNIAVWDRELAARLLQDVTDDLRVSTRLDLDTWRKRSRIEKAREWLWSWFGEVF